MLTPNPTICYQELQCQHPPPPHLLPTTHSADHLTGSSSPALAPFLSPSSHSPLSNISCVCVCLDLLVLTQPLSAQAWEVVLRAAAHKQHGATFMTGQQTPTTAAGSLFNLNSCSSNSRGES